MVLLMAVLVVDRIVAAEEEEGDMKEEAVLKATYEYEEHWVKEVQQAHCQRKEVLL